MWGEEDGAGSAKHSVCRSPPKGGIVFAPSLGLQGKGELKGLSYDVSWMRKCSYHGAEYAPNVFGVIPATQISCGILAVA